VHLLNVIEKGEFYILGDHCEFLKPLFVGKLEYFNSSFKSGFNSKFKAYIEENEYLPLVLLCHCAYHHP